MHQRRPSRPISKALVPQQHGFSASLGLLRVGCLGSYGRVGRGLRLDCVWLCFYLRLTPTGFSSQLTKLAIASENVLSLSLFLKSWVTNLMRCCKVGLVLGNVLRCFGQFLLSESHNSKFYGEAASRMHIRPFDVCTALLCLGIRKR